MISINALDDINRRLTVVRENSEAILYYCPEGAKSWGRNYNIVLEPGQYLAVSKETKLDVWSDYCAPSTKGTYTRAMHAYEKYSPKAHAMLRELFPSRFVG